ncbi:MAG: hypothetical protein ABID83_00165 [Candidatus Omnitrophota bacterium]
MFGAAIPEKVVEFIREEAQKKGYKLVDISARGGSVPSWEIAIDKEGGITLDECSAFSRKIMSWMNEQGIFEGRLTLDVCSPGLDRELKKDNEFSWAVGKQVEVRTHQSVDGRNAIVGKLLGANDEEGVIIEEVDGNTVCVDKDNVAKARLWVSI